MLFNVVDNLGYREQKLADCPLTFFLPLPLFSEPFYFSVSLTLKLIILHLHPTVTTFVPQLMQMKRVSSVMIWWKQPRLMFLSGPEMWMFTVRRGLITFLQQLKSIGPLMGPIKRWEKPIVTMDLIVSEWNSFGTLQRVEMCGTLNKGSEGKDGFESGKKSNKWEWMTSHCGKFNTVNHTIQVSV